MAQVANPAYHAFVAGFAVGRGTGVFTLPATNSIAYAAGWDHGLHHAHGSAMAAWLSYAQFVYQT